MSNNSFWSSDEASKKLKKLFEDFHLSLEAYDKKLTKIIETNEVPKCEKNIKITDKRRRTKLKAGSTNANKNKAKEYLFGDEFDLGEFEYSSESSSTDDDDVASQQGFLKVMKHLAVYPPSNELKTAHCDNFSTESLVTNNRIFRDYLQTKKLRASNVHHVFQTLLEIEDLTSMSQYPALAQKDVALTPSGIRTFWIDMKNASNCDEILVPFMDEVVIIPKASAFFSKKPNDIFDTLLPHPHEHEDNETIRRRIATVEQVTKERVTFKFCAHEAVGLNVTNRRYDIIFRPRRLPLRYQHRALELLSEDSKTRRFLFPTIKPHSNMNPSNETNGKIVLINETIATNTEQFAAVQNIVNHIDSGAPYIVFGPPGTGKTTTIVEAIIQLRLQKPRSRILVTAGPNSACNTIALRICEYFNNSPYLKQKIAASQSAFDVEPERQIIRIFSKSIIEKGLHNIDPLLLRHSNCSSGMHEYPSVAYIRKYGIVVATLCTVGKLVTAQIGEQQFFSHIFIDEAAASTEPETLVGIMGIKSLNCCVILAGDHKQLGPILKSNRAAELGLELSMMERLLQRECYNLDSNGNYDRTMQARLRSNYRSHPEIVRLYNHLYYNNELLSVAQSEQVEMAAEWSILPNPKFPIIFQAVHGTTGKQDTSPSSYNSLEIQVLMWYLNRLLVDGINRQRVDQSDIGIITPYKLQCKRISQQLVQRGWHEVEVGSVETFQGREKAIIVVSLVRSFAGLGFVRNPRRLNVILSRAKSLLILIGNPLTLRRNSDFKYIIDECIRKKTFLRKKKVCKLPTCTKIVDKILVEVSDDSAEEIKTFNIEMATPCVDIFKINDGRKENENIVKVIEPQTYSKWNEMVRENGKKIFPDKWSKYIVSSEPIIYGKSANEVNNNLSENQTKTFNISSKKISINGNNIDQSTTGNENENTMKSTDILKSNTTINWNRVPVAIRRLDLEQLFAENKYSPKCYTKITLLNLNYENNANDNTENDQNSDNSPKKVLPNNSTKQTTPIQWTKSRSEVDDGKFNQRLRIVQQIVRPCIKCPMNYIPVLSYALHNSLRYTKHELIKFNSD